MTARLEKWLRGIPTYRIAFQDLNTDTGAGAKLAVEILGAAGRETKLRHVQIAKPSIGIAPLEINLYSVATTGSTNQAAGSNMQLRQSDSTYPGIVRLYTSNPDASTGTLFGTIQEIDVSTGEVLNEAYGDRGGLNTPTISGTTQSIGIAITSTGANILNGYVEFTVEPYT